jgi:hypothetical protein
MTWAIVSKTTCISLHILDFDHLIWSNYRHNPIFIRTWMISTTFAERAIIQWWR